MLNFGLKQIPAPKLPFGSFLSSAGFERCEEAALRNVCLRLSSDRKSGQDAGRVSGGGALTGPAGEIRQPKDFISAQWQQRTA